MELLCVKSTSGLNVETHNRLHQKLTKKLEHYVAYMLLRPLSKTGVVSSSWLSVQGLKTSYGGALMLNRMSNLHIC